MKLMTFIFSFFVTYVNKCTPIEAIKVTRDEPYTLIINEQLLDNGQYWCSDFKLQPKLGKTSDA